VGEVRVVDGLAVAVLQVARLARGEQAQELVVGEPGKRLAHLPVAPASGLRVAEAHQPLAVGGAQGEEAAHEGLLRRAPLDREEIDDLDQEARAAPRARAHHLDQLPQAGYEALVADAQERSARDVADARRLDHEGPGLAVREAAVPVEHLARDRAVLAGAPRHHGGDPGARAEQKRADAERREEPAGARFLGRRPARVLHGVAPARRSLRALGHPPQA